MRIPEEASLTFDDVLLIPGYSKMESRQDPDIGVEIFYGDTRTIVAPVMIASMDTIATLVMQKAMLQVKPYPIIVPLHRRAPIAEVASWLNELNSLILRTEYEDFPLACSIGLHEPERVEALAPMCQVLVLELMYAFTKGALEEAKRLQDKYGKTHYIIVGNVATPEAVEALREIGIPAAKIGIGSGSVCSTRLVTGAGVPQLQAVLDCTRAGRHCSIISDGGIRNSGDAVKALAAGASMVMVGSLVAGTDEAGADHI